MCHEFDQALGERLNDDKFTIQSGAKPQPKDWHTFNLETDPDFIDEFKNIVSDTDISEADDQYDGEVGYNSYFNMEIALPH